MKLKFGVLIALVFSASVVNAQGGPRRSVEERVKAVSEKLAVFKLDADKQAKADSTFANYYRQQDKIREELMSGGERPDRQVMREKMKPATDARDKELKTLFTDEQFKKWKEEIEPSLSPRGGGGRQ